jgi:predicted SAM-dependent methyltransferase
VHASFVLEHLPDPAAMLRVFASLLREGGALVLSVPNDDNPVQRAAVATGVARAWWYDVPHHLNYFTVESLTRLTEREGFRVVDRLSTYALEQALLMGDSYLGNDQLGRRVHERRMAFELAMDAGGQRDARLALYRAQATAGIGREAVVVGVRR